MTRARDIADTQKNLGGPVPPFVAGKNKIINGDFGIWQRGTSFTFSSFGGYTADRFEITSGGGGVVTATRGAFTAGTAPVAGVESQYFLNLNYTTSGTSATDNGQYIEDVRTFAGQTVTFSVYAKVTSGTHSITPQLVQRFGSGGSGAVGISGTSFTATTSWQRFTSTVSVPSIAGKTVGAGSSLQFRLELGTTGVKEFQFWGFQVEAGSVATAFQTATGTIQGELAACQRYYERATAGNAFEVFAQGWATSTTNLRATYYYRVPKRVAATSLDFSTLRTSANTTVSNVTADALGIYSATVNAIASSMVLNVFYTLLADNSTNAFIGFSAEL